MEVLFAENLEITGASLSNTVTVNPHFIKGLSSSVYTTVVVPLLKLCPLAVPEPVLWVAPVRVNEILCPFVGLSTGSMPVTTAVQAAVVVDTVVLAGHSIVRG